MGDLLLRVIAAIAALVLLAVAAALMVSAAVRLWERQRQREPLPNTDLPALDPATAKALDDDIQAFEAGERP